MSNGGDVSDEVESSVPSSKKPKTSVVWEFFEKYLDENGQPRARCLNCATTYAAKNTSGTSNLKSHLLKCVEGGDVSSYSVILSFAVILDPRFKLQFVEYCYGKLFGSDGEKLANDILDKLKAFFQEYLKSSKEISGSSSQSSVRGSPQITSSDFADFGKFQSKLCGLSRKESDLQSYLDEPKLDHKKYEDLDILEYWKANEGKYPEVAMMARDVLSIPITTVASESSFSIGGRILDKYRSTLLPDNVEALLCTHDWLCGTPAGINLDGREFVEDLSAFSSID